MIAIYDFASMRSFVIIFLEKTICQGHKKSLPVGAGFLKIELGFPSGGDGAEDWRDQSMREDQWMAQAPVRLPPALQECRP